MITRFLSISKSTVLAAAAVALLTAPAFAFGGGSSSSSSTNTNTSGSAAQANNITNNYAPGRIKQRIDTTASAIAPSLTAAGVHSCAGSASLGVGGTGFNFGIGSTYEMIECNRRAYAATLSGMGQNAAALALVCYNAEVQAALNLTGVICPQQRAVAPAAVATAQAAPVVAYASFAAPTTTGLVATGRNPCHGSSSADMIECGKLALAAPAVEAPAARPARRAARR